MPLQRMKACFLRPPRQEGGCRAETTHQRRERNQVTGPCKLSHEGQKKRLSKCSTGSAQGPGVRILRILRAAEATNGTGAGG